MLDLNKIILIGYSGHGKFVAETALELGLNLRYYSDRTIVENNYFNLSYLGSESEETFKGWEKESKFILGIGDNKIRSRIAKMIINKNKEILNVISSYSIISKTVKMGYGNFISKNVSINSFATIGDYTILNTGSIIEHDCVIQSGVHVGPGAVLAGAVSVGNNSFIGANSVVKQGVKIGSNVIVGAGTVVLKDVPDNVTIVGNPGRIL